MLYVKKYVNMYVYVYEKNIYKYISEYVFIYTYTYIYICICICIYVKMYICKHVYRPTPAISRGAAPEENRSFARPRCWIWSWFLTASESNVRHREPSVEWPLPAKRVCCCGLKENCSTLLIPTKWFVYICLRQAMKRICLNHSCLGHSATIMCQLTHFSYLRAAQSKCKLLHWVCDTLHQLKSTSLTGTFFLKQTSLKAPLWVTIY